MNNDHRDVVNAVQRLWKKRGEGAGSGVEESVEVLQLGANLLEQL